MHEGVPVGLRFANPTYPNPTYPNPTYPNPTYPNPTYPNPTYPGLDALGTMVVEGKIGHRDRVVPTADVLVSRSGARRRLAHPWERL